jgi:hypothetical protein
MNRQTEKRMLTSGEVIYQPHRLQQTGSAPMPNGGVEYVYGMESVGDKLISQAQEIDDMTPVNISTLW